MTNPLSNGTSEIVKNGANLNLNEHMATNKKQRPPYLSIAVSSNVVSRFSCVLNGIGKRNQNCGKYSRNEFWSAITRGKIDFKIAGLATARETGGAAKLVWLLACCDGGDDDVLEFCLEPALLTRSTRYFRVDYVGSIVGSSSRVGRRKKEVCACVSYTSLLLEWVRFSKKVCLLPCLYGFTRLMGQDSQ
ncbi:hypothetical protein RP20_CCG028172 [Aedes albopictus]|nr:hypothetical protein RP20_CCG028172 [Aedes albopictus]